MSKQSNNPSRQQCGTCRRIYLGTTTCPVCWHSKETQNVLSFIRSFNHKKEVDAYA